MKNKKKNRSSYSLSVELKNALKYKAAGKTGYLVYDRCGRKL